MQKRKSRPDIFAKMQKHRVAIVQNLYLDIVPLIEYNIISFSGKEVQRMKYLSTFEAAEKWGISHRRVSILCNEGRIPGASRFGRSWAIPENAEKPADPRKMNSNQMKMRYAQCPDENGT